MCLGHKHTKVELIYESCIHCRKMVIMMLSPLNYSQIRFFFIAVGHFG